MKWDGPNVHDLWRDGKEVFADGRFIPDLMVEAGGVGKSAGAFPFPGGKRYPGDHKRGAIQPRSGCTGPTGRDGDARRCTMEFVLGKRPAVA